jgi:hypothetical protein
MKMRQVLKLFHAYGQTEGANLIGAPLGCESAEMAQTIINLHLHFEKLLCEYLIITRTRPNGL